MGSSNNFQAPYSAAYITASGTLAIAAAALVGIVNNTGTATTGTVLVYDGSAASGQVIANFGALAAGATYFPPSPGLPLATRTLTVVTSATPGAGGIQLLYRVNLG